jgi:hypothetical protein
MSKYTVLAMWWDERFGLVVYRMEGMRVRHYRLRQVTREMVQREGFLKWARIQARSVDDLTRFHADVKSVWLTCPTCGLEQYWEWPQGVTEVACVGCEYPIPLEQE